MENLIGRDLGRYHILEQLGEGGMAVVYKAFDTRLEADVAVKVIRTDNLPQSGVERALKRFEREAKSLAKLTHPNIVPIIDFGEYENSPYLVMKYLPGGTLKHHLKGQPMPWQEAAPLLIPVARALDYAHRQNMVHRDVKPSNILITSDGEPMLTDFGIAKILNEEVTMDLTGSSATVGTPEYMAPEQVVSKNVDHRADIYALGVVFYEMVTGRRPFQADTPMAVLFKHVSEPLPRPKQFVPDLPEDVEKVLLKSLAKDPNDRYQTMAEFAAAFERLLTRTTTRPVDVPVIPPREPQPTMETRAAVFPPEMQVTPPPEKISRGTVEQKPVPVLPTQPEPVSQPRARSKRGRWIFGAIGAGILCILFGVGAVYVILTLIKPATPVATELPTSTIPSSANTMPAAPATVEATPTAAIPEGDRPDSIVFTAIDSPETAIAQLKAGQIDIYGSITNDVTLFATAMNSSNLKNETSYTLCYELTFNPAGATFTDGRLNPFSNQKIREAVNWLVDRNYIAQEIYGGLAVPKYLMISGTSADYERYSDAVHSLENEYAYDPGRAEQTISAEMASMGASRGSDGRWRYRSQPVTIIMIIRTEDKRQDIGDYVADQLESIGFAVDRQYKSRNEASPIWLRSDPAEGQWHIYTGAWAAAVSRDDGSFFGYYYTSLGNSGPLWEAYQPSSQFVGVAERLWNYDFQSMDERAQLFNTALELSMQDSAHVWLVDSLSFSPMNSNLIVASDIVGNVAGAQLWPYTIRFEGREGGTVNWAQSNVLVEPWNPVAGSNWIYDQSPIRATQDYGIIRDPVNGLFWPQRIERAEVVARQGLPLTKTLDWVSLRFEPSIRVPTDAWADWDASNRRFITVGEKYPQGTTANIKCTVYYPADLFDIVRWHDGSALSVGDFVMNMIMKFDIGKTSSPIYDENISPDVDAFLSHFKGVRILSENPLVIETYDDYYQLDAELNVNTWWSNYTYGPGAWHTVAVGILAESNRELAFSPDNANNLGVEWMSYVSGPSLEILSRYVDQSAQDAYIPYVSTMGQYVSLDEARIRWENLQSWYRMHGHFWVGTGPFYLDTVDVNEQSLVLQRNSDFPDVSSKWDFLMQP